MAFFGWGRDRANEKRISREGAELLDQYHHRASVSDGEQLMVAPGKVLENVTVAMERVDLDVNTPISIREDVASESEIMTMAGPLRLGRTLAVHVVNTAMRIMTARYPAEMVTNPLPPVYDLRVILPQFTIGDREHDIAKAIFNKRTTSPTDLTEDDLSEEFASLDPAEQVTVFMALFFMFGTKIGAMKNRLGVE